MRIAAFGSLQVWAGDRQVELSVAKSRALLAYLAADPGVEHSRAHLASLLWPEVDEERSKQSLRSALYQLRRAIDVAAGEQNGMATRPSDAVLRIDHARVAFQAEANVTSDVSDFSAAVERIASHDHTDVTACGDCFEDLEIAADLYRGDFLSDIGAAGGIEFEEWLLLRRESFQNKALRSLDRLVQIHLNRSEHVAAHDRAFQILALHRYDEFAHRAIMSSLAAQGHFDQALAHYESSVELIRDELGVEPSSETVELAISLQAIAELGGAPEGSARGVSPSTLADGVRTNVAKADSDVTSSPIASRRNLPFLRNPAFVGRTAVLERIASLMIPTEASWSQPAAVVVSGIGGIGKTQLAIEYCYQFGDQYPGGVQWINCEDPLNIIREVAALGSERGLGLFSSTDGLPLQEQVELVCDYWRVGPLQLIVFDNCEDTSVVTDWLPTEGQVSALFTSRKSEWPFEMPVTEVPIRPLLRNESVEYLTAVARHLSPSDAMPVAEQVGDHPLALRFAAQFLARLPSLSAPDYVDQLRESSIGSHVSFQGVDAGYSPTDYDQSVERTFSLSMQRLIDGPHADAAKRALARLSCVASGVGLDRMFLLETMADLTDAAAMIEADRGLQRLLDHGLVTNDEDRQIVMHRLVKDFVSRALVDPAIFVDSRHAIEQRVSSSIGSATFAGPEEPFESPVSRAHLTHIVQQALHHRSPTAPLLALALGRSLRQEWETTQALDQLSAGIELAADLDRPRDQGRLLVELVVVQFQHGATADTMKPVAQRAVEIFERTDPLDVLWLAVALDRLGMSHLIAGEVADAYRAGIRSLELGRTTENVPVVARCLRLVAGIEAEARGNFAAARALLSEALDMLDPVQDREAVATTMDYMGMVCSHQGDYAESITMHRGAAELCAAKVKRNLALMYVAGALLDDNRPEDALQIITDQIHDGVGTSVQLQTMFGLFSTRAYVAVGDLSRALSAIQNVFDIADNLADPTLTAHRWRVAGLVAAAHEHDIALRVDSDDVVDASTCFSQAVDQFEEIGFTNSRIAATLFEWAQWEHDAGRPELSLDLANRGKQMFLSLDAEQLLERYAHLLQG